MQQSIVRHAWPALLASLFVVLPMRSGAQNHSGRITGRIVDAKSGSGIADAVIIMEGSGVQTRSVIDGRFNLTRVPSGSTTLIVRRIGYAEKHVSGVSIGAGEVVEQNVSLEASAVTLGPTVVTASAERGTVNEALDRQRTATAIVNSVTSEQISRSGDGDAAQAVRRVSGVTLQSGKYVFVRGLGERYTTASLDGARIPSPEPEKKIVPLDLFPAGLLEAVTTTKTFTPDQPGDFSGAQVDIRTKAGSGRNTVTWSAGSGYNAAATGKRVMTAPLAGAEWLGFGSSKRSTPSLVRKSGDFGSLTSSQLNEAAHSFRNVWTPAVQSGTPNYSGSLSLAGRAKTVVPGLGYLVSGTYGYTQEIRSEELHSAAVPGADNTARSYNEFRGSSSSNSILWGGLANLSALVGGRTLVTFNNNYNRSADNEARELVGTLDDFGFAARKSSLAFVERSVRSNQFRIERMIGSGQQLDVALTASGVTRKEPDKSELQYVREPDAATGSPLPFALFSYNPDGARRTFSDLRESSLAGSVDYRLQLGQSPRAAQLKVGGALRHTRRDADNSSYSLLGYRLSRAQRERTAEAIFADPATQLTALLSSTGGSYTAGDRVGAGYAMVDLPLGERVKLIGGARLESSNLRVNSVATTGERVTSTLDNIDLLPSLVANISTGSSQNLRFSATRTLSRPEYRELSPVTYRDVVEQRDIFGNPDLRRTLITNVDARWEWFPNVGEIVAMGVFAKWFDKPIERVDVATSGASRLGFINADGATNYGIELEMRKTLSLGDRDYRALSVFANGTLMKSTIDLAGDQLSALTNERRAMVGQAPYVVNAGTTWSSESAKTTATVLYNVVGRRITAAGTLPLPDTYESARHGFDLSLQMPVFGAISARLDARNLLDSPYEVTQGSVVRERYKVGRVFALAIKWQQ